MHPFSASLLQQERRLNNYLPNPHPPLPLTQDFGEGGEGGAVPGQAPRLSFYIMLERGVSHAGNLVTLQVLL